MKRHCHLIFLLLFVLKWVTNMWRLCWYSHYSVHSRSLCLHPHLHIIKFLLFSVTFAWLLMLVHLGTVVSSSLSVKSTLCLKTKCKAFFFFFCQKLTFNLCFHLGRYLLDKYFLNASFLSQTQLSEIKLKIVFFLF